MIKFAIVCASILLLFASCSNDETDPGPDMPEITGTIWNGPDITFTKEDRTNPLDEANQDRLTDTVWITRGLQGQIYNAVVEFNADKEESPTGTEWALGSTNDLPNLSFSPFRTAVTKPKEVVGKSLVLHLIVDDIYLDVMFTSWSSEREGGFSYVRSTE